MTREEAMLIALEASRKAQIGGPQDAMFAAVDALLASGFRYVEPDEVAAARLAGKVEGMEEAARIANAFPCTYEDGVSLHAENMTCARIASAFRAKITELKTTTTPVSPDKA